jgi:hypothetical protein
MAGSELICQRCREYYPIEFFCKDRRRKERLYRHPYCRSCRRKIYLKNKCYQKKYQNKRYKRISERLVRAISIKLHSEIKGLRFSYGEKQTQIEAMLGYAITDLMEHLQIQFQDGMNWENYGRWVVRHRRPKCSLHYDTARDRNFKIFWSLNNIFPCWTEEARNTTASTFDLSPKILLREYGSPTQEQGNEP